ncbi:2,3-bisphosphoglycerate-independent phosphoglycerate mutase [Membranihabitans maritimus]|uniref:2,3-bisphosphoglycerate-independent phosphoglycerate mutase n=1 Tax=Membranihabitans maritimus TaxID=2904244 RepID=UPI001EFFA7D0|nr:2,3-bisphosphoglycerate-independent phosphoglycerate mutase [Membranihabitans maritimus]
MKKCFLMILDGWGIGPEPKVSAIAQANTPYTDSLYEKYPHAELVTYGMDVGLPEGQMGNSEVGHLNIGAGRIVYQELARINKAIQENTLKSEKEIGALIDYCLKNNKPAHILGLLSDGGVHSHIDHVKAVVDILVAEGIEVFLHCFLDGRDTDPEGGKGYLADLIGHIENTSAKIASITGRYYAMDRDNRWERTALAYNAMVKGEGKLTHDPLTEVQASYDEGVTDEFIKPLICADDQDNPIGLIREEDAVFFVNFRTDRPRQITKVLTQESFPDYKMKALDLYFVTMTNYDQTFENLHVVYSKEDIKNTLGEFLSASGKTQVRIAETEKYPHVTFFFSGGREKPFEGESRILINSPKVATYDLKPEMSAFEITEAIENEIENNTPDFICLNYANADMVGHTGDFDAAVKAAETVDECVKRAVGKALEKEYTIIVIADHGNSDYMINEDGSPNTAHTKNPVPVIYIDDQKIFSRIKDGKLGDLAPTILTIMGLDIPDEMTGNVLVEN